MLTLFIVIAATMPLSLADTSEAATYLMCDPAERLVEIQVCDYSNSPYGGICFYELRERPFRTDSTDLRSLAGVTVTNLPSNKERELRTFLGSRLTKVEHRPPFDYGLQSISQQVPPYRTFKVHQKMILCGPYAVPTPESVPAFDVPRIDRWMLHHPSKKLFYISSEKVVRAEAERKCRSMGGSLAVLADSSQYSFVASIFESYATLLRQPLSVTDDGVWTAATNYNNTNYLNLQWKVGRPQYTIFTSPVDATGCVITLFQVRQFSSVGCDTSINRYVCEKSSDNS